MTSGTWDKSNVKDVKTYTVRYYRKGDEEGINRLYNELLPLERHRSLDEWRWKFLENPAHVDDISRYITLVEGEGQVVGQYAIWPVDLKYKDSIIKAGHPVENFIHPDYRLAFQVQLDMMKKQDETAQAEDIPLGFGFPNRDAYLIGKRFLGYKDIEEMPTLSLRTSVSFPLKRRFPNLPGFIINLANKVGGWYLMRQYRALRISPDVHIEEIRSFSEKYDEFWNRVRPLYPLMAVRDSRYMNWRYMQKPTDRYTAFITRKGELITGCVVMKTVQNDRTYFPGASVGLIMEFMCLKDDDGSAAALLTGAIRHFISEGADFAVAVMLREDFLYEKCLRAGFVMREDTYRNKAVYKMYNGMKVDEEFIMNPAHWHITLGDFDPV